MSIYSEGDAQAILRKVVALSKADECTATLDGSISGNVRYALNNISTSGIVSDAELQVQVAFGKRAGIASINEFGDAALARVVARPLRRPHLVLWRAACCQVYGHTGE